MVTSFSISLPTPFSDLLADPSATLYLYTRIGKWSGQGMIIVRLWQNGMVNWQGRPADLEQCHDRCMQEKGRSHHSMEEGRPGHMWPDYNTRAEGLHERQGSDWFFVTLSSSLLAWYKATDRQDSGLSNDLPKSIYPNWTLPVIDRRRIGSKFAVTRGWHQVDNIY